MSFNIFFDGNFSLDTNAINLSVESFANKIHFRRVIYRLFDIIPKNSRKDSKVFYEYSLANIDRSRMNRSIFRHVFV